MRLKTKLKAVLCLLIISNNISVAGQAAVVEDRSISADTDVNTFKARTFQNRSNAFSNSNQVALNEDNASYAVPPSEHKFNEVNNIRPDNNQDSNKSHRIVTYKEPLIEHEPLREQPIYNATINQPSRQQILKELESLPINARIGRLENIIETQKNLNGDDKIRVLQDEIQSLRGMLEAERHQFEKAIAQQKALYEDLDRRLNKGNSNSNSVINSNNDSHNNGSSNGNSTDLKNHKYTDDKLAQQDLYTMAYTKIKNKDYPKAIELFNKYIETYPKGIFVANSHYWLGEIYMIQSDYNKSLDAFDRVLKNYPTNSKSAEALYKKGLIHIYLKQFDKAKILLSEVKTKYKNTTAARLADQQLQGIENINSGV